jgi:hypothetical protein
LTASTSNAFGNQKPFATGLDWQPSFAQPERAICMQLFRMQQVMVKRLDLASRSKLK